MLNYLCPNNKDIIYNQKANPLIQDNANFLKSYCK